MGESLGKAVEMDAAETGEVTSSVVEDAVFIVRKSVRRSITSGSVDCVCALLNNAAHLLDTAYIARLRGQLKDGYPVSGSVTEAYLTASASAVNVMTTGKLGGQTDAADASRARFLLALNNAAASERALSDLKTSLEADIRQHLGGEAGLTETARMKAEHSLSELSEASGRLRELVRSGLEELVSGALKPRIRTGVEAFQEAGQAPDETAFSDYEVNDPWLQTFMGQLDATLRELEPQLVEWVAEELVVATAAELGRQLEKALRRSAGFNRLGGLQLDKELRELSAYLTSKAGWAVREKLGRLSAMAGLLNSESVAEARDFYQASHSGLAPSEAKHVLSLRRDLPIDQIRTLVL